MIVFCFTRRGVRKALELVQVLPDMDITIYAPAKYAGQTIQAIDQKLSDKVAQVFPLGEPMLFICSAGIAVRSIAPLLHNKLQDPAVLCMDENGIHVVSLIGGHVAGSNRLAKKIASAINADPVITTATDLHSIFSVDNWAIEHDMHIANPAGIKYVSSALLEGENISIESEYPIEGNLPYGISKGIKSRIGIYIGHKKVQFQNNSCNILQLIPRNLVVGIGCKKNILFEELQSCLFDFLDSHHFSVQAIQAIASINLKQKEPALQQLSENLQIPFYSYTAAQLNLLPGHFSESEFVQSVTGVDCVCERSAVYCSGGAILVPKSSYSGITMAIAEIPITLSFEEDKNG